MAPALIEYIRTLLTDLRKSKTLRGDKPDFLEAGRTRIFHAGLQPACPAGRMKYAPWAYAFEIF
jgi:hypothetical protein